jgi:hypothetical protein
MAEDDDDDDDEYDKPPVPSPKKRKISKHNVEVFFLLISYFFHIVSYVCFD